MDEELANRRIREWEKKLWVDLYLTSVCLLGKGLSSCIGEARSWLEGII